MSIFILIILLLIACYLILYKNVIQNLEDFVLENMIFIHIFIEHGFLFFLTYLFISLIFYFFYNFAENFFFIIVFIIAFIIFFNDGNNYNNENNMKN